MQASLTFLTDGGLFATFIDWRGYATVYAAAVKLGLTPLNLIVWMKTNAGMGSLYRSQHELLPLFKKGQGISHQQCGARQERSLALQCVDISGGVQYGVGSPSRSSAPSHRQTRCHVGTCAARPERTRRYRAGPISR